MSRVKTKACPFCREEIRDDAIKCRFCQSALIGDSAAGKTERLAEYVIKSVGVIPIMMSLLLAIAGVFGIKSAIDVSNSTKRAENAAAAIEDESRIIDKLSADVAEIHIETLLLELDIDSKSAKAEHIRGELRDFLEMSAKQGPTEIRKRSVYFLAQALFDYYDHRYDDGLALLRKAGDSVNKFRLGGALWLRKGDEIKAAGGDAAKYYAEAYGQFVKADHMAQAEHRLLVKTVENRAVGAARLGKYREAETAWLQIFSRNLQQTDDYYLVASMYSRWGKPGQACAYLEKGLSAGLAESPEIRRKDVSEDADFANVRASREPAVKACYARVVAKLRE